MAVLPAPNRSLRGVHRLADHLALRLTPNRSPLPRLLQDQLGDNVRLGDQREMARLHLDRGRAHPFGHEAFEIGIDRPVLGRDSVKARLRLLGRLASEGGTADRQAIVPCERRPSNRRDVLTGSQFPIKLQAYPNMVNIRNNFARINQVKS
jgi:hypothetical protein